MGCIAPIKLSEIGNSIPYKKDPVAGSVHCMITPYWTEHLGKSSLKAYQASKRGDELICEFRDNRVIISGGTAIFAVSEIMRGGFEKFE